MLSLTKRTSLKMICLAAAVNLTACGTILHPERKGQGAGRLDPGIVVLDAVGLLFFLIPGVIAFAFDFSNGTIYLPGGKSAQLTPDEIEQLKATGKLDEKTLQELSAVLEAQTAQQYDLTQADLRVTPVQSREELALLFKTHTLFQQETWVSAR